MCPHSTKNLLVCYFNSTKRFIFIGLGTGTLLLISVNGALGAAFRRFTTLGLEVAHNITNQGRILRFEPKIGLPFLKCSNLVDLCKFGPNDVGSFEPAKVVNKVS
jgi:hypothetical protein